MDFTKRKVEINEIKQITLPHLMTNTVNSAYKTDEGNRGSKNKMQRVRGLITEYEEDEDLSKNHNHVLNGFVQKINVDDSSNNSKIIEALGNHVVLTEIFKCGCFGDLNNFRLVNKQWKEIANSTITQRRLWKLTIDEKFGTLGSDRDDALLQFNDCIEASEGSFPITSLDFADLDYYDELNGVELLRFYAMIGQRIRHVAFSNFGPISMSQFQDLLVSKMPNVNHIEAGNIDFTNQEECLVPLALPYLETITFVENRDLDSDEPFKVLPYYDFLLRSAKNLKKIIYFPIQLMNIVIEIGKMDCIQSFDFELKLKACALSVKFSQTKPKLTSLAVSRGRGPFDHLDDDDGEIMFAPEFGQSLKRILISSKDTLKDLNCVPRVFPVDFTFPTFANLEFLTVFDIDAYQSRPRRVFPPGSDCCEIFPNLHSVVLVTYHCENKAFHEYFPGQEFPSVKTVVFADNFKFEGSLKAHFPNVSHIKILNFKRMLTRIQEDGLLNSVSHLELDNQIECLEFHQCLLAPLGPEYHLDPLFTGVPAYICKKLLEKYNTNQARGEDENIMAVEEILKLVQTQHYTFRNSKGLRRLKLIFNHRVNYFFRIPKNSDSDLDSEKEHDNVSSTPVISPVSCAYGFSQMPNLEQVVIGYDHYLPNASDIAQVFKPFAKFPYIKIVHEPTIGF